MRISLPFIGPLVAAILFSSSIAMAQLSVMPGSISFMPEDVDRPSFQRETLWIQNYGRETAELRFLDYGCRLAFEVTDHCYHVPAGGSCTAEVRFRPNFPGEYSCDISIEDWKNPSTAPVRVWVRGSAYRR
jgi:hypothetical protein